MLISDAAGTKVLTEIAVNPNDAKYVGFSNENRVVPIPDR